MRKQTLVFLLFFLGSCQNKDKAPFLLFGDGFTETPKLEFQYGSLEEARDLTENTSFTSFDSGIFVSIPFRFLYTDLS